MTRLIRLPILLAPALLAACGVAAARARARHLGGLSSDGAARGRRRRVTAGRRLRHRRQLRLVHGPARTGRRRHPHRRARRAHGRVEGVEHEHREGHERRHGLSDLLGQARRRTTERTILNNEIESDNSFKGEADSSQSNRLDGNITVTVAERMPNGNLLVRGEKRITLNQGEEYIRLAGHRPARRHRPAEQRAVDEARRREDRLQRQRRARRSRIAGLAVAVLQLAMVPVLNAARYGRAVASA